LYSEVQVETWPNYSEAEKQLVRSLERGRGTVLARSGEKVLHHSRSINSTDLKLS